MPIILARRVRIGADRRLWWSHNNAAWAKSLGLKATVVVSDASEPAPDLTALFVKVRDGHRSVNKAARIAVSVDLDGIKHVLGTWVQTTEGAKFWLGFALSWLTAGP